MRLFLARLLPSLLVCCAIILASALPAQADKSPKDSKGMMAMVLQQTKVLPTTEQLADLIKASPFGAAHTITVQAPNRIAIDQAVLVPLLIDQPIPSADAQDSCAFAKLYWPEACAFVKGHQSHIILYLHADGLSAVERAQWLTHIVGAVLRQTDSVDRAVYWGNGLSSKTIFLKAEDELPTLPRPVYVWVSFNFLRNDDNSVTLVTNGMEQFGLMQIEIVSTGKKMSDLWSLAGNVASYLMDQGPVIKDGDTLGYTEDMKVRIKHEPSTYYDSRETVYRLYVDDVPLAGPAEATSDTAKPTLPPESAQTPPTAPDDAEVFPPEEEQQ